MPTSSPTTDWLVKILPAIGWLREYRPRDLPGDLMAGAVVAIMLVPQSMAYAMLAGLPPQTGLYASIAPLVLYSLFGSSRTLAVGPVAMVSLLVASAVGRLAAGGGTEAAGLALTLAALVGIIQVGMGLAQFGFVVHFLSHPVISGFTNAAAVIIALSQVKHLLGIGVPHTEQTHALVARLAAGVGGTNLATLFLGLVAIGVLVFFGNGLEPRLRRSGLPSGLASVLARSGPLVVVAGGTLLAWGLQLDQRVALAVVGEVPAGLPPITFPALDPKAAKTMLGTALAISFVGFMESISVAKALASKRRQRVEPNRELVALGAANLGAAFSGGYPVTGGLSRSMVNFSSGANTGLASILTAFLVAATVVALTPLFRFVPQVVLAGIVLVAVWSLIDVKTPHRLWCYSRADFAAFLITFLVVLAAGVETGVIAGVATALLLFLWRTSRPHIAVVGRVGETEHYRNIARHRVATCPGVLAIRVDASLYFANARFLEENLLRIASEHPGVKQVVLVCSAINGIDASALETLETLNAELRDSGVGFRLAEVKGPVMDRLRRTGFPDRVPIHLSLHEAMVATGCSRGL